VVGVLLAAAAGRVWAAGDVLVQSVWDLEVDSGVAGIQLSSGMAIRRWSSVVGRWSSGERY
jgi:hypothetical protein